MSQIASGGGVIGAAGQLVADAVIKRQLSSGRDLAAAFVGGAVTAETALYAIPTLGPAGIYVAGAAGGAATVGVGYGAWFGAGGFASGTLATPTFGQIYSSLSQVYRSLSGTAANQDLAIPPNAAETSSASGAPPEAPSLPNK